MTKYRWGVLTGEHLGTLREVFASMCADVGAKLVGMDGEDDHVHLLVTYLPTVQLSRLMNSLKGVSARRRRQHFWVSTHREHLWSPSYFAASAGGAPLETLRATSASSAPLAGRANPALNGRACARRSRSLQRVEPSLRDGGTPPFSDVGGPSSCWSVGSPFTGAGFTTAGAMVSACLQGHW